jgi:hypothetical protein
LKFREKRHVGVDLGRHLLGIVAVMGQRMMRFGNAELGVRSIARFPRQLKRNHACDIPLQSQKLQVEHQAGMICIGCRNSRGAIAVG